MARNIMVLSLKLTCWWIGSQCSCCHSSVALELHGLELLHGWVSSEHVEDSRGYAGRCHRANCCSSRDAHQRCSLELTWQHRMWWTDVTQCTDISAVNEVDSTSTATKTLKYEFQSVEWGYKKTQKYAYLRRGNSLNNTWKLKVSQGHSKTLLLLLKPCSNNVWILHLHRRLDLQDNLSTFDYLQCATDNIRLLLLYICSFFWR